MKVIDFLVFYVNGKEIIEYRPEPEWTLLWYLRNKLKLTGSKLGCGDGGCGACTVMLSRCIDPKSDDIEHRTINACLTPLCSIDGCHIITVEGLGSVNKSNLHPTQQRLADLYASQCGFCTPGMVMSLYDTVTAKNETKPTLADIEEGFDGNLCRCTGYRPILDAGKTFACDIDQLPQHSSSTSTTLDKCRSYTKENHLPFIQVPFPDRLRLHQHQFIHIKGSSMEWFRPIDLKQLLQLRHSYPGNQSALIFGNTRIELQRKYDDLSTPRLISLTNVEELQRLEQTDEFFYLGAGVTFTHLKMKFTEWNTDGNPFSQALLDQLEYFASKQIRNIASIGGNIIAASSNSDINPLLIAAGALLEFHQFARIEPRRISLSEFYLGDHQVAMLDDEVLVGIIIPKGDRSKRSFLRVFKQAERRDVSKGIVSAAFHLILDGEKIHSICLAFGGMASKTVVAHRTSQQLIGRSWSKETLRQAYELLLEEMPLNEMSRGGRPEYRRTLVQSFLFKFYAYVTQSDDVDHRPYHRTISHAQQTIPERPSSQKIVGDSIPHRSAYLHTTGEAIYIDDMPSLVDTLHAALVLSRKPNARIKNIDSSKASKVPGFFAFIDYRDVPGPNQIGGFFVDEEVFVSSIAPCVGAIIGVVLCQTEHSAHIAAELIDIEYELLSPTILSIDEAIEHQSYFGKEILLHQGDVEQCFRDAEHIIENEFYIGSQEHFYMETNACMIIPSYDDHEVIVYLPTQSLSLAQETIAHVLGRDLNRIICRTKRMGGAFGGKESRCIPACLAACVAAVKYNRPVRLRLERHIDMAITGHRHSFKVKYRVAFDRQGVLIGLDLGLWSNAGFSMDISVNVMRMAMLHMGNCYRIPHQRIRGYVCKTHLPSNTAFRGLGGPQVMLACETIIEHVATHLNCDPLKIRRLNLFKEGDRTHHGQILERWNIPRIVDELLVTSDFIRRQNQVKEFNVTNRYRKRGISLIPAKFGLGFTVQFLNQAGALVHIYRDGSVLIQHGGVEFGQGLYTKMIAIAAEVLGCPLDRIRISDTATDKTPNATATVASVASDLNGMAVKHACEQLRQRLDSLINDGGLGKLSWNELINQAYFDRVDLSARGFYATPDMFNADFEENRAKFNYFTQGAAVTEIELDVLTGDWLLRRVDILMDVGKSLNPQIDIGQIEGAFVQGIGLYTMEELIWGDQNQIPWVQPGELYTSGPDTYKIPAFSDVPRDFRVSLLADSSNPRAVFSSKGVGEPPLLLSSSVFFALKQACMAYREQQGFPGYFTLSSPATVERLRMACADEFTERVCANTDHTSFQVKGSF